MTSPSKRLFALPVNLDQLAQTVTEVSTDLIKLEHSQITSRWFHSARDIDLFLWVDQNAEIVKQQVSMFGQVAEWTRDQGLKTGWILEEESNISEGMRGPAKGSELVQYDLEIQPETLAQAKDLISRLGCLEDRERRLVIKNFHSNSLERSNSLSILRESQGKGQRPQKASWWRSIWLWWKF